MSLPNKHLPGTWIMRLAQLLLEASDVERFVAPAIADLQHEYNAGRDRKPWSAGWAPTLRVLVMLVFLSGRARIRLTARTRWYALLPALMAVVCGISIVRTAGVSTTVPKLQAAWLILGLVLAWLVATSSRRLLERTAVAIGLASVAALALTAWFGESVGSATRWMAIGPIRIQTSTLVLPVIVLAISTLFAKGSVVKALAMGGAAQLALIAQPDGASSLIVTVATVASALGARTVSVSRVLGIATALCIGSVLALVRDPNLHSVPHVEGVFDFAGAVPWKIAALVSLALVPLYPTVCAFRMPRADVTARSTAVGIATVLIGSIAMPLFGSYPVPLVGYGGSSVVACMIGLSFVLALEPGTIAPAAALYRSGAAVVAKAGSSARG